MKNKFGYLLKYSLKKKIDTKWFKAVNVLLCLLLIFLINMDYVIEMFGGGFNEKDKIYVVDHANQYDSFSNYLKTYYEQVLEDEVDVVLDPSALERKDELKESGSIIVVINTSPSDYLVGEIISYDTVSRNTYDVIVQSFNAVKSEIVLKTSGLSSEEIAKLTSRVPITETVLNLDAKDNQTKETLSSLIATIVIVPFFILIVSMVQMLGAEINDEKSSRGMEIIISSVPAKLHFLSKVLSSLSFVLLQGLLLFGYAVLGIVVRGIFTVSGADAGVSSIISGLIEMLREAGIFTLLAKGCIPLLILFIVSFAAYAIVSATLASMTTNIEDFQQLQTPLMILMMVGYYVALMAVVFDGSIFITILAYVPLLSVLIAPTLFLLGEMSLISLIGTTCVTCISTILLYHYGLKVYKVGILNYSSSKLWGKMFKSLKNKN